MLHKDIKGIERVMWDANKRLRIIIRRVISLQKTDCREPRTLTLTLNLHIILHLTLPLTPTAAPTLTLSLKPEVEDEENGFCISVVHRRLTSMPIRKQKTHDNDTTTRRAIRNFPRKQEGKPAHNRGGEGKKQNLKPWI